jgi:hypothetical protein
MEQFAGLDGCALLIVGEHVGETEDGGVAFGVLMMVALDRAGDRVGQAPSACEDASDERVVNGELVALLADALLGRACTRMYAGWIAGVGVHEDELAEVVYEACEREAVAVLVLDLGGDPICGSLSSERVTAEVA